MKAKANTGSTKSAETAGKHRAARSGLLDGDHGPEVAGGAAGRLAPATIVTGSAVNDAGEVRELVERVNRRGGSPLVTRLDRPRREAAAIYATAFEIVEAGGVSAAGGFAQEAVDGGRGAREGRQFQAVRWAETLRRLEAVAGPGVVPLDARGRAVPTLRLLRMVLVGGLSLARALGEIGMKRTAPREKAMRAAIEAALSRMAADLGLDKADAVGKSR